jgi:hypothetical protein
MQPLSRFFIRPGRLGRLDIAGDPALFRQILADLLDNAGPHAPSEHWMWVNDSRPEPGQAQLASLGSEGAARTYFEKFSRLNLLLDAWVGCTDMQRLDPERYRRYEDWCGSLDELGLLPQLKAHAADPDCAAMNTDLGTVVDLNLLYLCALKKAPRSTICEVGGGYGRLAEGLLALFAGRVCCVMVDAVPGSLMYAYLYMKACFPELRIGSYYNGDVLDPEKWDCYVAPTWHFEGLAAGLPFDLCVNIESMQEMNQWHVNYYLQLFNRILAPEGTVYLSNAKDYVFKGTWPYPANWQRVFCQNTPRSWTRIHPTEIFRNTAGNWSAETRLQDWGYQSSQAELTATHAALQAAGARQEELARQLQAARAQNHDLALILQQVSARRMLWAVTQRMRQKFGKLWRRVGVPAARD